MQISIINNKAIELTYNGNRILLSQDKGYKFDISEYDLCMGEGCIDHIEGCIYRPGEYEFAGVEVVALDLKPEQDGISNIFRVIAEDVSLVALLSDTREIDKHSWDLIGETDILLIDLASVDSGVEKHVQRFAPYVVVAYGADESTAEKVTGLSVAAKESKFKFQDKDFTAEDPAVVLNLLQK